MEKRGKDARLLGKFLKSNALVFCVLLAALAIIASTLFFSGTAKNAAEETTVSVGNFYLEEIAARTVYEISAQLDESIDRVKRTVSELKPEHLNSISSLRDYLSMAQNLNGLDIFALVDANGIAYTSDGTFSGISRFGFLSEPIVNVMLYTAKSDDSKEMALVAMPTENLAFGDTRIVSCVAGIDVDKIIFPEQLQGNDDRVVCRLFNGDDGTCIVGDDELYLNGGSIFDVWKQEGEFEGDYSCEKLISDWNAHREGYSYYTAAEGSTYLYYKNVPGTNWMVSVRIRKSVISNRVVEANNKTLRASYIQLAVVIISMLIVSLLIIIQVRKTQSERFAKEKEEELLRHEARASEEKLKLHDKLLQEEKELNRQAYVLRVLSKEYSSVYYVDLEENTGVPMRVSDVMTELYGIELNHTYSFKEVYRNYITSTVVPEQVDELLRFSDFDYLREKLRENDSFTYLYRIIRGGREIYAQLRIARFENDKEIRHIVLGFAIVDDEVRGEQEKQRALKEALAQAENANRAKTVFLNNMSHDIRTPMNAIIGYTNIAMKRDIPPEVKDCLEKIRESSDHLLTLINDVLDISRIESGKTMLNLDPVDITKITDVVLDITNGFLTNRDVTLKVKRDSPGSLYVMADSVKIREVLVNILSNAVKFTEDGGSITFEAVCRQKEGCDKAEVVYRVSDTGIGMSEEYLEHVFDEFSQEEYGARTQYKGTGLGMAISKRYVELMGGTITAESQKGRGSVFTVELTFELAENGGEREAIVPVKQTDLKGVRVLLAEDNDLNAEIAIIQLEELGMLVTRAKDGREAVEKFAESPEGAFDLILMDIMMPNMNGYEATAAIRNLEGRPDGAAIPIIAMTANAFAEDIRASLDAGMNAHVAKPIVMEDLVNTIAGNLNSRV